MTGTSPHLGRTLRLFLVDGAPTGILTAEIMNWTGLVAVAPRSRLADLIARPETSRTGVYFLTGQDPGSPTRPVAMTDPSSRGTPGGAGCATRAAAFMAAFGLELAG